MSQERPTGLLHALPYGGFPLLHSFILNSVTRFVPRCVRPHDPTFSWKEATWNPSRSALI